MDVLVFNNFANKKTAESRMANGNLAMKYPSTHKNRYFSPLQSDIVSFTGALTVLAKEKEGACKAFSSAKWDKEIFEKLPFLKKLKTFTEKDYQGLSKNEKEYLNEVTERIYNNKPLYYKCPEEVVERSIKRDFTDIMKASECIKSALDKKYKNGYIFVSIGGSPSIFAKTLEQMGVETIILPFSKKNLAGNISKIDFKKYFAKFGLTEDFMKNSKKQIVFADYVSTHETFNVFNKILDENGLKSKKTSLESIWSLFSETPSKTLKENKINSGFFGFFEQFFFNNHGIKAYRPCPKINDKNCAEFYNKIDEANKKFGWDLTTKLMNFSIIDFFHGKTLPNQLP